jgi:hypothetical protein
MYVSNILQKITQCNCAGVYDEMRVLEVEDPAEPAGSNQTAAEEEELLYGSDREGEPGEARGAGEPGKSDDGDIDEEEEKARKKAEKEAEEAGLLAKQAELSERIRRRKAEREKKNRRAEKARKRTSAV